MADITNTFLSLAGLTHYDEKIKAFLANADLATLGLAKEEIAKLEAYVGKLPEDASVTTVIEYINKKTEGIATDAALAELQSTLESAVARIKAIEDDYLTSADRTAIEELITAEADRAKGVEGGLDTRLAAVEGDYLKAEDKQELSDAINTEKERAMAAEKANSDAIDVLNGEGEGSVKKTVDDAINKFATDVTNDEVVNSYKELIDWVAEHGSEAAEMAAAIEANEQSIADLEKLVGKLPEGETSADIVAYIKKLVDAEQTRAEGVEAGLEARIKTMEDAVGTTGGKTVAEQINEAVSAVQGEVDALEEVVDTKADASVVTAIDDRVKVVEEKAHTHANEAELNKIAEGDVAKWNAAEKNAKDYADGLAGNYDASGAADQALIDAKAYADGKDTAIADAKKAGTDAAAAVEALEAGAVATNASDISSVSDRVTVLEGVTWEEISNATIDGLFA